MDRWYDRVVIVCRLIYVRHLELFYIIALFIRSLLDYSCCVLLCRRWRLDGVGLVVRTTLLLFWVQTPEWVVPALSHPVRDTVRGAATTECRCCPATCNQSVVFICIQCLGYAAVQWLQIGVPMLAPHSPPGLGAGSVSASSSAVIKHQAPPAPEKTFC